MSICSGSHKLVSIDLSSSGADGTHINSIASKRGISIKGASPGEIISGEYTTRPIPLGFDANELIMSWNANSPMNSATSMEFRTRATGGDWSIWFQMGLWKSDFPHERAATDPNHGKLFVDHYKAASKFNEVQCRAIMRTSDITQAPLLRRITICASDTASQTSPAEPEWKDIIIPVPWISQYDMAAVNDRTMIDCGVCGATSVTMTLNSYGIPASVRDVGKRAYDPVAKIYGNWAFLAATASEYGPESWVERFSGWAPVMKYIELGVPVIITIKYPKGTFTAEPEKSTAGHLLVVRGFTKNRQIIVNDPDTTDEKRGNGYAYPADELEKAFQGHGGVGIIIRR